MHRYKHEIIVLSFLLVISLVLPLNIHVSHCQAAGSTLWVDDDYWYPEESDGSLEKPYTTIHAAVAAAQNGDTINIRVGTYTGDLTIDKSVTLRTEDVKSTLLTSNTQTAYVINIKANAVSLEGLTILDTTNTSHRKAVIHVDEGTSDVVISENVIKHSPNSRGVYLEQTTNAVVKNNNINDTWGIYLDHSSAASIYGNKVNHCGMYAAVHLFSSHSNRIENNILNESIHGIYLQDSTGNEIVFNEIFDNTINGIKVTGGSDVIIANNTIYSNKYSGIELSASASTVINNVLYLNNVGISLSSSQCLVYNNHIFRCSVYGLHTESGSRNNDIYGNTFENNWGQYLAKEDGTNQWDDGTVGNYWDDFLGPDNDEDGIGDIAYTKGGVRDQYPTGKFQNPPVISNPSPAHLTEGVDLTPTLSVTVEDPEGGNLDVYFYYILENVSYLIDSVHNVKSGSRASIPFYSTIQGKNAVYTYLGTGFDYICVWYVIAKDQYSETKSSEWIFSTLNVPIDNEKPTANPGGPYSGEKGKVISFDGSMSNDDDGTIEFYRWSFGDDTSVTSTVTPQHIYTSSGTFEVSLVVIDNDGSSNKATAEVTITEPVNDPPVANANGHYTAKIHQLVFFFSSGSYDPDEEDSLSYSWDFGDGNRSTEINPTHIYEERGNFTVSLTVTDPLGLSSSDFTYITVSPSEQGMPGFTSVLFIGALAALVAIIIHKRGKERGSDKQ
jgi:parallel beta-helix repeat protein